MGPVWLVSNAKEEGRSYTAERPYLRFAKLVQPFDGIAQLQHGGDGHVHHKQRNAVVLLLILFGQMEKKPFGHLERVVRIGIVVVVLRRQNDAVPSFWIRDDDLWLLS